jgi:pseudouridine-5'-phosphate glycosidase
MDDPEEIAAMLYAKTLTTGGGTLIANPVPESFSMDGEYIQDKIDKALEQAEAEGIKGKAITPYLLDQIQKITGGESLKTNIALVKNNAKLAAEIAAALEKIRQADDIK